jgi:hypothetical protein
VLSWNAERDRLERWHAQGVVMATPLFVARRLLEGLEAPLDAALSLAATTTRHAPWLVANLELAAPLLERVGVPPAWDNVVFQRPGAGPSLGYVDARHQSLRPDAGLLRPQLITAYLALPEARRGELLRGSVQHWTSEVLASLAPLHPDLPAKLQLADLMRWGHAMSIPVPGARSQPARAALRQAGGRVRFAHADLAGYSVFEEAFTLGTQAGAGWR